MSETLNDWTAVISTDCTCTEEDGTASEYCNDFCWIMNGADTSDLLNEWVSRNGESATDTVVVGSERMNWNGVCGYTTTEPDKVPDALAINGQYRLDFKLVASDLTIMRYSHDEPTGASFKAVFVPDEV